MQKFDNENFDAIGAFSCTFAFG